MDFSSCDLRKPVTRVELPPHQGPNSVAPCPVPPIPFIVFRIMMHGVVKAGLSGNANELQALQSFQIPNSALLHSAES